MTKIILTVFLPLFIIFSSPTKAAEKYINRSKPALLPLPQKVEWKGKAILFKDVQVILPKGQTDALRTAQLKSEVTDLLKNNRLNTSTNSEQKIIFKLASVEAPEHWKGQADEAYTLVVENQELVITGSTTKALYYGLQTLRQLMVHQDGRTTIASCHIHDYPAFKIRGCMQDVARNFYTMQHVKKQIDIMAKHKYNVYHIHLSEYQGWRLESKIYPNLTHPSSHTRQPGKHYTQAQFVAFVDYCWARGITVIPEFDSPGHSTAFRKGVGVENMKDPRAIKAIIELFNEICSLIPKEKMPYIHIGTDEVRRAEEKVNNDYLPALHAAIHKNNRELIGWWHGMHIKGDTKQIQQTWAQFGPLKGLRHIDSRSNYLNHLEALDFASRMFFQQPCKVPHGNEFQLGGILCQWYDTLVDDQDKAYTNNPTLPSTVAYSEAVWKGIAKDRKEFWAKLPSKGTPEFTAYADFEDRIAELRDRFYTNVPFPMVKTYELEWSLLGPLAHNAIPELEEGIILDQYKANDTVHKWDKPVYGAAIHTRHFFNFSSHIRSLPKGQDIVWGKTYIYSPKEQEVGAWISFNTISSSDDRAGTPKPGNWSAHSECKIWLNGKMLSAPTWKHSSNRGSEVALIDEVYASREPYRIKLKKGWNPVLMKSARKFKWVFSFSPVEKHGQSYREVEGLKYSATKPN